MISIMTTTDAVKLSAAQATLIGADIESAIFDSATGGLWRSIIPMRLMVDGDDASRARFALRAAGFVEAADGDWDLRTDPATIE
jgi:hypothetical protein